jgi:hypothetical protein
MGCGCSGGAAAKVAGETTTTKRYKYRIAGGGESTRTFATEMDARTALAATGRNGEVIAA